MADTVTVRHTADSRQGVKSETAVDAESHGEVTLEWESSPMADCIADAVVATLLQTQGPPAAIGVAEEARRYAYQSIYDVVFKIDYFWESVAL